METELITLSAKTQKQSYMKEYIVLTTQDTRKPLMMKLIYVRHRFKRDFFIVLHYVVD